MIEMNQQYIAERLGLSRATVSRCFTNHPGINPNTRAKVFQIAAEIGYAHLETRTATKRKKAKTLRIGVLICSDEEEYNRQDYQNPSEHILSGVSECAVLNKAEIEVHLVDPKSRDLSDFSDRQIDRIRSRWNGVILIYPFPAPVIDQLASLVPVVSLVEQFDHTGIDCVDVDHYKGISAAVEHLVEHGHRKIGFFTRNYSVEASWSFRRYAAYVEKMARLRMATTMKDLVNVYPSRPLDEKASIDHVAARVRAGVTAWVCAADHQAYDLVRGLQKRGIKVPRDVSITGFDGIDTPKGNLELATVQIPYREIGAIGMQRLIERIRKRFSSSQHVLIDCRFKSGSTVGRAPQR